MKNSFHKYFYINPSDENWGFYVNTVGYTRIGPHTNYPLNREHPQQYTFNWNKGRVLDGYHLVFICKGQGIFESAFTASSAINEGTCFFLYPGVWHRYKPDSNLGWEEYWIGFNGSYPNDLMNKGFFEATHPLINVGLSCDLLKLFQQLVEMIRTSSYENRQVIAGITLQILGVVNAIANQREQWGDPVEKLINKAKFLMQESLDKPAEMEALARQLPMGYSAFRKAFKNIVGESPNQYHLNLRLKRAADLLTVTTLNISEIADQTGFDSLFYFSRLFKKKNGMSPKDYRAGNGVLH